MFERKVVALCAKMCGEKLRGKAAMLNFSISQFAVRSSVGSLGQDTWLGPARTEDLYEWLSMKYLCKRSH